MIRISGLSLSVHHDQQAMMKKIASKLHIKPAQLGKIEIVRRSIDARKKQDILYNYTLDVEVEGENQVLARLKKEKNIEQTKRTVYELPKMGEEKLEYRPVVVGFGPAGIFAALSLARKGYRPIVIERGEEVSMPTEWGTFRLIPFKQKSNGLEHIALFKGDIANGDDVLVRVHSSCMTGDIFGSQRCECGEQLHKAMQIIEREGRGVVVYLNQEGRGIGLMEKIKAYKLQENGLDTVDANIHLGHNADERDYGVGANILRELGISRMRLMTNNPIKRVGLEAYGLEITEIVPVEVEPNEHNARYMQTKKERMGHILHFTK